MSVLYLGPYRQTDINGQISRFLLNTIIGENTNGSVVSRPIYIDPSRGLLSDKILFNSEHNKILSKYDTLVQHMPVEHMQYMPDIAKEHYAFPMIDNIADFGMYRHNFKILSYFNKIFVQSQKEKQILEQFLDFKKIHIFTPEINIKEFNKIIQQKYQFANYVSSKKFYFIGNLDRDESIIKKIIFSMYAATAGTSVSPVCVFFLDFDNKPDIALIDSHIKKIRSDFGLPEDYRKEIFIFKHFSENELIVAHGSCDIYLSLNDSQTYYLHEKYASLCDNNIISLDDICDTVMPYRNNRYNHTYGMSRRYVSTTKLIKTLKDYL